MRNGLLGFLTLLIFTPFLFGQDLNLDQLKDLKMRSIGPSGMSGRVTSIDALEENPNIIYVGTASGGVWQSDDGGINWDPIFDDQPVQSIGAVAIDQSNPDVLWAGTGEGNPRNSHNSGKGIYKSLDGGKNWELMGLEATKTIHRIIIDPRNSNVVYVAALGSAWGPNTERGVYKTTDGGENWEKVLYMDDTTGAADLVMDPQNPNKLIAAMWEYGRKPWFFNSGGDGSGMYVTYDGGQTWEERTEESGLPKRPYGRMGLAIAPSDPKVVYALVESSEGLAMYQSEDGGFNFKKRGTQNAGNRPFYYADIFVDPHNENRVYSLWSMVSRSEDGGKTFEIILNYGDVHPDHHAFWIDPKNPDLLINGNDGGLAISRDRGKTWQFVHNLPVGQFYHVNYDMETPYNVYGGMQDNGSWIGPSAVWQQGGIRNHYWQELLFGDGFDVVPQKDSSRYGYAMYQGGNVYRYDRKTGETEYVQPVHPEGEELRFNWNGAIAQDPFKSCGLYFGSQFLHYSKDCGKSWDILSPDLTTNDSTKQQQAKSGGLTIDATKAENFTTITAIAPSLFDEQVIFVGTDDGNVQVSRDGGESWTNVAGKLKGLPGGSWIQQIVPSAHNAGEFFVVANNYRRNDWAPYAYRTTNYGKSWERIAGPDKVKGHTWSIVQDPEVAELLFLGTEYGLYFTMDGGESWQKWDKEFPSAPARDLKIHPREHDLIVGTFGRSIYILDDIRPLRRIATEGPSLLEKPFVLFETQPGILASYKSYPAPRFAADESFQGENDTRNAVITYYLKEKGKDARESFKEEGDTADAKGNWKKIHFTVVGENGDTVRNFSRKADTGLVRTAWGMNMNGVRYPTRREIKEDEDPASGISVLPGKYKLIARFGKYSEETTIEVLADPREQFDGEATQQKIDLYRQHEEVAIAAFRSFEHLKTMKQTIEKVNNNLALLPDSTQTELKDHGQEMIDSIKNMMALYMTPEDFEGYDHVTVRLNNLLYSASSYINSAEGVPGENARSAMQNAKRETEEIVNRVNAFVENEWKAYREKVESLTMPMFEEMDSVEIEE